MSSEGERGILCDLELLDVLTQSQVILRQPASYIYQVLKRSFSFISHLCICCILLHLLCLHILLKFLSLRNQDSDRWGRRRLGGGGIEQKGERTHGYGQQCGDC